MVGTWGAGHAQLWAFALELVASHTLTVTHERSYNPKPLLMYSGVLLPFATLCQNHYEETSCRLTCASERAALASSAKVKRGNLLTLLHRSAMSEVVLYE